MALWTSTEGWMWTSCKFQSLFWQHQKRIQQRCISLARNA